MRLARSRTADGTTVPIAARRASGEGHWFDLRQLTADVGPETLSAESRAGVRVAIDVGRLQQSPAPVQFAPPYLRDGDIVELEIDGLGRQRQHFRAA